MLIKILFIILLIVTLIVNLYLVNIFFSRVPFIPIHRNTNKEILSIIKENNLLCNKNIIYDLGSGDGRFLFLLGKEYKDKKFIGYEIGPFPFLYSKIKYYFYNIKNVEIRYGNFFKKDLSDADFIFCYLFNETLDKLLPKLEKELKKEVLFLSCDFKFKNKTPYRHFDLLKEKKFGINRNIYIYKF